MTIPKIGKLCLRVSVELESRNCGSSSVNESLGRRKSQKIMYGVVVLALKQADTYASKHTE